MHLLNCPWCGRKPSWNYGVTPDKRHGVSVECDSDDCPMPDDAATARGWPYECSELVAVARWNNAASADKH